jgi:threonine/homoserine/homoserine lactone efflux protein
LIAVNTVWQTGLWAVAEQARRWLGVPMLQRAVSWGTGAVMMLFAVFLLIEHAFG